MTVGQDADQAWADVILPGDSQPTPCALFLIACDGGASPVRKQVGVTLEDLGFDEHWLVVDAIVSEARLAELPQTQVQQLGGRSGLAAGCASRCAGALMSLC